MPIGFNIPWSPKGWDPRILQPIRSQEGSFSWKEIDITPAGKGHEIIITTDTLPAGTSIPILGNLIDLTYIPEKDHPPPTTHTYIPT